MGSSEYEKEVLLPLEGGAEPKAEAVAELEEAVAAIKGAAGRPTRTSHMASLELACRQMRLHGEGAQREAARSSLLDGLVEYFGMFGSKSVCYSDMDVFVQHICPASKEALVARLEASLPDMDISQPPADDEASNVCNARNASLVLGPG
jgi:hypothetical protein